MKALFENQNRKMPKDKKKGPITGSSNKHAPLGQQISDDINRSKYAAMKSSTRGEKKDKYSDAELLNEKETKRIFDLGREQMLEIEMEEQRAGERKRRSGKRDMDSSDEEDNVSAMGEILDEDDQE